MRGLPESDILILPLSVLGGVLLHVGLSANQVWATGAGVLVFALVVVVIVVDVLARLAARATPQPTAFPLTVWPQNADLAFFGAQGFAAILQVICDVGKQFERLPSTYKAKTEEDLRDHFLLFLEPLFQVSATGETFNKTGKTDILLRKWNSNVFVAECKFWRGPKSLLDAITQLLAYLTWRDTQAAVMLFVPNKEMSTVLGTVELAVPQHKNFLRLNGRHGESWFSYIFHLDGDRNCEVHLAVLAFHFPENAENEVKPDPERVHRP